MENPLEPWEDKSGPLGKPRGYFRSLSFYFWELSLGGGELELCRGWFSLRLDFPKIILRQPETEFFFGSEVTSLKLSLSCLTHSSRSQRSPGSWVNKKGLGTCGWMSVFNQWTFLKYIWARLVPVWQIWFTTGLCPQGAPHCWGKRRNKDQNLTLCKCPNEGSWRAGAES